MTAAILCIGSEVVRGEIVNTNASWLGERLASLGFDVVAADAVPDEPSRIEAALARLGAEHDVLISTGGLGPTTDDITRECVARLLGVELERDAEQVARIHAYFYGMGREPSPSNLKQADLPRGARPLLNDRGTAPGFSVRIGRAEAFFLPGVPGEMQAMFGAQVEPTVSIFPRPPLHQVRLSTFGLPEGVVNDRLSGIEARYGVTLGYRVHTPELEVKVVCRGETDEDARHRAALAVGEVRARLGAEVVFAEGPIGLPEAVAGLLRERGLTLALAESCTGGLVAEFVTSVPGASDIFLGGAVTYANSAKRDLLGVSESLLASHGAVSAEVAQAMAEGAKKSFHSDLALALTGIAGPGGGSDAKPVGLVHCAVATAEGTVHRELRLHGSRERIRRMAAFSGLALIRRVVLRSFGEADA
jgi:nicotinamide-nucleotide amidase